MAVGFRPPADAADASVYMSTQSGVDTADTQGAQFVVPPNEEIQIVALLTGFPQPPSPAKFEIFASQPQTTGGSPAVPAITATATRADMRASWTFNPATAPSIHGTAWIRATAGSAVQIVQVGVADPAIHDLQWKLSGSAVTVASVGDAIVFSCSYSSHGASDTPVVEIFDAADVVWDHATVNSGATAVATPSVTEASNHRRLTAPWTAALPPSATSGSGSGGAGPQTAPRVFARVTIGSGEGAHVAISPPLFVLPPLRLSLEPGDPNWLMEPIVYPASGPPAHLGLVGAHPDHEHSSNANPDAGVAFPKRVLGIKQRLQALGYYYETLAADDTGKNKQTRVFRRCFRWYWENVDPADTSKPVPFMDAGNYYGPDATTQQADFDYGTKIINLFPTDQTARDDLDGWCRRLEDAVRAGVLQHEPPGPDGIERNFDDTIDFTTPTRMIFPGDFHFHQQETIPQSTRVDYTYSRTNGHYATQTGGNFNWTPSAEIPGDYRNAQEELRYNRNTAIGRVPIVAKVQMQVNGNWVDGPAEGIRVHFQLVAVRDDSAAGANPPDPPYFDTVSLRQMTRVTPLVGAFGTPASPSPRAAADPQGPWGYLREVHQHFRDAHPSAEADPTWWNAPVSRGGKRGTPVAGNILATGANARALNVPQVENFPWSASDASQASATPRFPRSVSIPVVGGKAALVFAPSRRGGDSYKIRAFIASPTPPAAGASPSTLFDLTTEVLTVWRRVRITRYFRKLIPPDWPDQTIRDMGGSADEASNHAPTPIDWGQVHMIFRKAFLIIEPPTGPGPHGSTDLTFDMRKQAIKGAVDLLKRLDPPPAGGAPNYANMLKRWGFNSAAYNPWDPDALFKPDTDSPYIAELATPTEYEAAVRTSRGAAAPAPFPNGVWPIGEFPFQQLYSHSGTSVLWGMIGQYYEFMSFFGLFLDPSYSFDNPDPQKPYDAVPAPGLTCVQALQGDNLSAVGTPERTTCFRNSVTLRAARGANYATRADFVNGLGRASNPGTWNASTFLASTYTAETGDQVSSSTNWVAPNAAQPNQGTLGWLLDDMRTQLTAAGVTMAANLTLPPLPPATAGGTPQQRPNPDLVDGRIVFETGSFTLPAAVASQADPIVTLSIATLNPAMNVTPTGHASATYTATSVPILKNAANGGGNASGDTFLRDLAGYTRNTGSTSVSLKSDILSFNPNVNLPDSNTDTGATLQDLANMYLATGATSATIDSGKVVVQFPSVRSTQQQPTLSFSQGVAWFDFNWEMVGGVNRFTSKGRYLRITAAGASSPQDQFDVIPQLDGAQPMPLDDATWNAAHAGTPHPWDKDLALIIEGHTLEPGDALTIVRRRDPDVSYATATTKDGTSLTDTGTPVWKTLDFTYQAGTTLRQFFNFLSQQANLDRLSRDPGELEFAPVHTFPASAGLGTCWFYFREKNAFHTKGPSDGFTFEIRIRTGAGDLKNPFTDRSGWPGFIAQLPTNGWFLPSGLSVYSRTFYMFYGSDDYNNAGVHGPDPTGHGGQGYRQPGSFFCYPLINNTAHEMGHMQYLRHQWTGASTYALQDHDRDDLCHMSYVTSFVELDANNFVPLANVSDLRAGNHRDTARAEPCGRCLLKLRGWNVASGTHNLAANAGPPAPATDTGDPPTNASNMGDHP
jgi:hypothetical protein